MLVDRVRAWLGAKIVHFGVRVAGFDAGKFNPPIEPEPDDGDDDDYFGDVQHHPVVELSPEAQEMVLEGMASASPPRPVPPKAKALAGSAAARIEEERNKLQAAMRPRRG